MTAPTVLLGTDVVDLLVRTIDPGVFDEHGAAVFTEQAIELAGCCVTVADGTSVAGSAGVVSATSGAADTEEGSLAIFTMKAALPITDETAALTGDDAIRFEGRTFELNRQAVVKRYLFGRSSHVRVFGSAEYVTGKSFERVTVTPRAGRDLSGQPNAAADPFDVVALAVNPGNSTRKYGILGDVDDVEFTVALPMDTPIVDDDGVTVRGRFGLVRVAKQLNRWADRQVKVATVKSTTGGAR